MVRGFRERGASESNWFAVEFHVGTPAELGVSQVRWGCFPALLAVTPGGAR